MKIKLSNSNIECKLLNGEYRKSEEKPGEYKYYYRRVGICGSNRILFHYIDTTQKPTDYIQSIIDHLPDLAAEYLNRILQMYNNVLVHMTLYPGEPTGYDIYYHCENETNTIFDLVEWMRTNNDFAAIEYNYTEIIDGHQKCINT